VLSEDACLAGCTHFDFGESGASKELAHFKTRFGARPYPYRQYIIERLPLTELDRSLRGVVKRVIRFQEPGPVAPAPGESAPANDGVPTAGGVPTAADVLEPSPR